MRLIPLLVCLLAGFLIALPAQSQPIDIEPYREVAERIIDAAVGDSTAYERTAYVGDTFGPRLSGSQALEDAIDWILATMEADGLENVRGQPVEVPVWIRGEESAALVEPREQELTMLGLGGSVATPPGGITAPVFVVGSFEELETRAEDAEGKIVVFNVPFTTYGQTVRYRTNGAVEASKAGAVASLVRSVGPVSLATPHTGTSSYEEGVEPIPHAALTIEGVELLQRMQERGQEPVVRLTMSARTEPDRLSRNVIGEIRGRESPEETVVLGGHIDSWDVGQGVVDDAAGCVVAWEAVRLIYELGLRPRRTLRVVMWTNEENGLRGAEAYRDSVGTGIGDVQLAIESDSGVFEPVGMGISGHPDAVAAIQSLEPLVAGLLGESPAHETGIVEGGGGADIGPLMQDGVPGMSLNTASERYFWVHHSPADTIDKLDPAEMARAVALMAVVAYVAAEMPERLPHGDGGE